MTTLKNNIELDDWVNKTLSKSVQSLAAKGVVESQLVEAKPSWVLPFTIMIGKIRESTTHARFLWFANSNELVHFAGEQVASTPREAARYFAMKWQIDSQKLQDDPTVDNVLADSLAEQSRSLLELVDADSLWAD